MAKKILLVEGRDDEHVIKALCVRRELANLTEIRQHQGVVSLLETLSVRIKESGLKNLGVVVDADSDIASRWISIRDRLAKAGYQDIPQEPEPNGVVLLPPAELLLPRIGVWLMPNNLANGILEDFIRFLIPTGDKLIKHAQNALSSLPEPCAFTASAAPKALIHTWLAWQAEPGRPLGQAITARFLDDEVAEVDLFIGWLRRLYL
jgi:hypothetical protein